MYTYDNDTVNLTAIDAWRSFSGTCTMLVSPATQLSRNINCANGCHLIGEGTGATWTVTIRATLPGGGYAWSASRTVTTKDRDV